MSQPVPSLGPKIFGTHAPGSIGNDNLLEDSSVVVYSEHYSNMLNASKWMFEVYNFK